MGSMCEEVGEIVLYKGESAIVYAWSDKRNVVEALLRKKAERVIPVNKVGLLAEDLQEDVKLDPKAVWYVRVRGRGVYQPIVERVKHKVEVVSICLYADNSS